MTLEFVHNEVPLTPTRETRLRLNHPEPREGDPPCFPTLTTSSDYLRSRTVVNLSCDHGSSAAEVDWWEEFAGHRGLEAAIRREARRMCGYDEPAYTGSAG